MKPQTLLTVLMFSFTQIVTAGGVYAAIRADLREAQVRVSIVEKRVDRLEDRER